MIATPPKEGRIRSGRIPEDGIRRFWRMSKRQWQLYLFMLIPFVYLCVFCYYPMLGLQIAFKKYSVLKGIWGSPWIGFEHFEKFFSSYQFQRVLINTIRISLYSLAVNFPLSIIYALFLNVMRNLRVKKVIQTITYIPHFISTVVMVGVLFQLFNSVSGVYGTIYRLLGGSGYPMDLFSTANTFDHMYVWSGVWQHLGWNSIIYISALAGVDPELHEAAEIDGATRLKRIWHIDVPTILPTASIILIMDFGHIMGVGFEKTYLLQNTMNLARSEVISTYIYKVGLKSSNTFSYGTAIGLFNSVINCTLLVLVNALSRRFNSEGASLW